MRACRTITYCSKIVVNSQGRWRPCNMHLGCTGRPVRTPERRLPSHRSPLLQNTLRHTSCAGPTPNNVRAGFATLTISRSTARTPAAGARWGRRPPAARRQRSSSCCPPRPRTSWGAASTGGRAAGDGDGDGEEAMARIRPSGRRGSEAAPGRAARRRQRGEARLRESSGTVRCTSRGPYFFC